MRPTLVRLLFTGVSMIFIDQLDAKAHWQSKTDIATRIDSLRTVLHETEELSEQLDISFSLAQIYEDLNEDSLTFYVNLIHPLLTSDVQLVKKVEVWRWLSELSFRRGAYKMALDQQSTYAEYADSLRSGEHELAIAGLELDHAYGTRKDSIENQLNTLELIKKGRLRQQRSVIQIGVIIFLVLVVLLSMLYGANKIRQDSNLKLTIVNDHLEEQNEKLSKLNRTKTRFFSIIAHDLRGPLSTFTGFYRLLEKHIQKKYPKQEEFHTLSLKVQKSATQITHLLDTLLSWALKEEGALPHAPAWIDVESCVLENMGLFTTQAQLKQIDLKAELQAGLRVFADKDAFMTILRNLLVNALKFTPEMGEVTVKSWKSDRGIGISIRDTGIGFQESEIDHVFDFGDSSTTEGTGGEKGTGLGLNLVTEFVRMNEGTIEVSSQFQKGTTFTLYFPTQPEFAET